LADLYEETDPRPTVLGFDDGAAYFVTVEDLRRVDLRTGAVEVLRDDPRDRDGIPQDLDRLPAVSPDGSWTIRDASSDQDGQHLPALVSSDGEVVTTTLDVDAAVADRMGPTPSWEVVAWLDDDTAVGTAAVRSGVITWRDVVLACEVTDGRCAPVPGTEDGVALPRNWARLLQTPLHP
ncbi:hypothetical protein, partial [Nocardioides albidus]|uniref:hypothetical protein n=1 Tax=Nocardioides albidus TaxID=1517589 RepID=UPI001305166C